MVKGERVTEAPTRRERLRTATLADIKRAARDLAVFVEPFAELWLASPAAQRPGPDLGDWGAPMRELYGDRLPDAALYVFLIAWTRMYGLIAMEVFGHMHWAVTDVEPLFEAEMAA